jgi:hypothetical protein
VHDGNTTCGGLDWMKAEDVPGGEEVEDMIRLGGGLVA